MHAFAEFVIQLVATHSPAEPGCTLSRISVVDGGLLYTHHTLYLVHVYMVYCKYYRMVVL